MGGFRFTLFENMASGHDNARTNCARTGAAPEEKSLTGHAAPVARRAVTPYRDRPHQVSTPRANATAGRESISCRCARRTYGRPRWGSVDGKWADIRKLMATQVEKEVSHDAASAGREKWILSLLAPSIRIKTALPVDIFLKLQDGEI